jgi:hypothetical protein
LLDVTVPAPRQGGTSYAHDMARQLPYDAYHVYADDAFAASGTGPKQGGIVIELSYRLASQLYADFDAQPREGGSPLQVQFRDLSWTPGTASIAKWEWDFDGDNFVDSTLNRTLKKSRGLRAASSTPHRRREASTNR